MAFRCSNCNGGVVFDVETQQMKCAHCGSVFAPESFLVRDRGTEGESFDPDLAVFQCGGCGAELESTEDSMVGFCPYCGGQSILKTNRAGRSAPERIIPFQVTREESARRYRSFAGKIPYLPKEMKDPAHLQSFTGIYMPYYEYDVEFGESRLEGTKEVENHFSYKVVNTYQLDAQLEGTYRGVPYDASRYLDDEIAARTLPYDTAAERDYHPAYLAGFYADAATVEGDLYLEDARKQAVSDVVDEVAAKVKADSGIEVNKGSAKVEATTRGRHRVLYPMWFLTWQRGDRVAYAVVNGQSGKVVSDLPLDMRAFALGCGAISAALFAVLELLFQPTPMLTSVLSLVAAFIMAMALRSGTRSIFEKQTHAKDKGWTAGKASAEPESESGPSGGQGTERAKEGKKNRAGTALTVLGVILVAAGGFSYWQDMISFDKLVALVVLLAAILVFRRVSFWQGDIPEKEPKKAALVLLAAVILNVIIVFVSPVNDLWYYLGDAVCIAGLLFASVGILRTFNVGTTRPMPRLFDRKEV